MSAVCVVDLAAGSPGAGPVVNPVVLALRKIGASPEIAGTHERLERASHIIIPGASSFGAVLRGLRSRGLDAAIASALGRGASVLAISTAFLALFAASDRAEPGLALLAGTCRRFPEQAPGGARLKVPMIGWNEVVPAPGSRLFSGIGRDWFYFAESSYPVPEDQDLVVATTEHGTPHVCACERGRLSGVLFHPEKSGPKGLALLSNFLS